MDEKNINNIISKSQMKIAISNFNEENVKVQKRNWIKFVASFVLTITVTGGLVYATGTAIEQIWKTPESYKYSKEVTQEEQAKCISEEEAKEIGNHFLERVGLDNQSVQSITLRKDYLTNKNIWSMGSQMYTMEVNAETGKIKSVNCPTNRYTIPYNYGITREEARKVAKELLEKYRPEDDNGEYELLSLKRNSEIDEEAYIWYADFYKKYEELINPSESIRIGWIPTINGLYQLNIESNKYENNEQTISKEDAIKIVTEKDKQIEKVKEIKDIKSEIRIKEMNAEVYLREKYKEEYENGTLNMERISENLYIKKEDATFYETQERVRKVWCVVIDYNSEKQYDSFTYYVDSSTGEIIGGQRGDTLLSEENLRNDPNNVIEK